MSMLVGYDLSDPRRYDILDWVVGNDLHRIPGACGSGMNLPNGPRFVDTEMSPEEVLAHLEEALAVREHAHPDHLLVLGLTGRAMGWGLPASVVEWLEDHGVHLADDPEPRRHTLAIAYTIRMPPHLRRHRGDPPPTPAQRAERREAIRLADRRRKSLRRKIFTLGAERPDGYHNFVEALHLVETDLSLHQVRNRLTRNLARQDELLILELETAARRTAAKDGWLAEHRVRGAELIVS